jgi:transposase
VWYFPSKLPELNPVEGCWDQLNEWLKHRLLPDLSTVKQRLAGGIPQIDEPTIWNYLRPWLAVNTYFRIKRLFRLRRGTHQGAW